MSKEEQICTWSSIRKAVDAVNFTLRRMSHSTCTNHGQIRRVICFIKLGARTFCTRSSTQRKTVSDGSRLELPCAGLASGKACRLVPTIGSPASLHRLSWTNSRRKQASFCQQSNRECLGRLFTVHWLCQPPKPICVKQCTVQLMQKGAHQCENSEHAASLTFGQLTPLFFFPWAGKLQAAARPLCKLSLTLHFVQVMIAAYFVQQQQSLIARSPLAAEEIDHARTPVIYDSLLPPSVHCASRCGSRK